MLPFKDLFQRLLDYTKLPLKTKDELEIIESTVLDLVKHHTSRLQSPWDVAKLISSIIRCNLIASSRVQLKGLALLGMRSCPVPSSRTLANLLDTRQFDYPITALIDAIRRETGTFDTLNGNTDALCVVLSILNQWHRIEVTCVGPLEWNHVEECSLFVGHLLSGLSHGETTFSAQSPQLFDTFASCWVSNLLTFDILSYSDEWNMLRVVHFLLEVPSTDITKTSLDDFLLSGLRSAVVQQQWQQLSSRILRQCRVALRNGYMNDHKAWIEDIRKALKDAFTFDPPFLSEAFYLPPKLTPSQCGAVYATLVQPNQLLSNEDNEVFTNLLTLGRACQSFALRTGHNTYVDISDEDVRCIKSVVIFSLHLGRRAVARNLLAWIVASGRNSEFLEWQLRLQACEESEAEMPTWPRLPPPTTPSMLFTDYLRHVSSSLSCSIALDALVTSRELLKLRIICEGSLHLGCSWGREMLKDPLAVPFLAIAASKVVHEFLNMGDAPMARAYLTMLGSYVSRCPTRDGLLLLLQVLYRFARVLIASPCIQSERYAGARAYEQWGDIYKTLAKLFPVDSTANFDFHGIKWRHYQLGDAFNTRRAIYRSILQGSHSSFSHRLSGSVSLHASYFTAVFIHSGPSPNCTPLTVTRRRVGNSISPWSSQETKLGLDLLYCAALRSNLGGSNLARISERIRSILRQNQSQLSGGTTSATGKVETQHDSLQSTVPSPPTVPCYSSKSQYLVDCDSTHICTDSCNTDSSGERTRVLNERNSITKEIWWAQRLKLDAEMGEVVAELENGFGDARYFMVGEVSEALCHQLWPLSEQIAAEIAKLRKYNPLLPLELQKFMLLKQKYFILLQGLPFLGAKAPDPDRNAIHANKSASFRLHFPIHSALYNPMHLADDGKQRPCETYCEGCHDLLQRASVALLNLVAKLWVESGLDAQRCVHGDITANLEGWFISNQERLQKICAKVAQCAFDYYYTDMVNYYSGKKEKMLKGCGLQGNSRTGAHVDLLEVPREHLYIVIENDLHHLPLEGMDVLRTQSCSRVPSLEFLSQFDLRGGTTFPNDFNSAEAIHFFIDSTAVARPDKFEALLKAHPEWTVDYADQIHSLRHPDVVVRNPCQEHSPLLKRLLQTGRSMYVYLGHKRGESQIPRSELYNRLPCDSFPDVLLMGCKSAYMIGSSFFESYGMPWAYVHAGAMCFIGSLWDVTNGEIDRLTRRFLYFCTYSKLASVNDVLTIGEALGAARRACKLPFLSGIATVMYGVNRTFCSKG